MPSSPALLLLNAIISPPPSFISSKRIQSPLKTTKPSFKLHACKSNSSYLTADEDLYKLLGVESSADNSQIKKAYRSLQKRCHPDIAGPAGHDMAIILNEVYALLSDPISRSIYDQEQSKMAEFRGYTGKPLYSRWLGSEAEDQAVFVDEIRCVGCLKCALFASKTFAIESLYGRARVVAQWADPRDKIVEAIQTCPVDCISIVERRDLAALEFLMAKQPRGSVRMTAGNTAGERISNVFADVSKFQRRFNEMKEKGSKTDSDKVSDESRVSAMERIRSITNWWYWQTPKPNTSTSTTETCLLMIYTGTTPTSPDTEGLREAAARLKTRGAAKASSRTSRSYKHDDEEYWTPELILPSPSKDLKNNSLKPRPSTGLEEDGRRARMASTNKERTVIRLEIPMIMAAVSSAVAGYAHRQGPMMMDGGVKEHIGGAAALGVVNSGELQVLLAGITWFIIGMAAMGMVEAFKSNSIHRR